MASTPASSPDSGDSGSSQPPPSPPSKKPSPSSPPSNSSSSSSSSSPSQSSSSSSSSSSDSSSSSSSSSSSPQQSSPPQNSSPPPSSPPPTSNPSPKSSPSNPAPGDNPSPKTSTPQSGGSPATPQQASPSQTTPSSGNAAQAQPSKGGKSNPPATVLAPPTTADPVPSEPQSDNPVTLLPSPPRASSVNSPPSSDDSGGSSSSSGHTAIIAGAAVAGVLFLAMIVICTVCIARRKRKKRQAYMGPPRGGEYAYNSMQQQWNGSNQGADHVVKLASPPGVVAAASAPAQAAAPPSPMNIGFNQSTFTYDELAAATGVFSQSNLLGQGGFGYVHKGVLPNGKEVAVKSLKTGSGQGEREFQAEVEIISRVHHRHLVSLVGYCIADGQRMLVYEFVPNKTLEFHLHGKGQPTMDWATRQRIALGSAKGLAYLHEDCHPRIIHRDIKAANILLDHNFEAMVADFGLAKLTTDNFTHVSTRVMGTFGYLAPEYASSGKLSEKSDVFSFGVMLLELITGRRPIDPTSNYMEDSLVEWARPLLTRALEDGNYDELVDPHLGNNYVPHELARMAGCAAAGIRHSARRRPKMSQIVRALEGDSSLEDLNEGVKPSQGSAYSSSDGHSSAYDTTAYNADMLKFRKMVLTSQEFESSEYGASSNDSREMRQKL